MNGNKNVGASNKRSYRTIKVNPTTSAIRAALAVSATMLALAGSGSAWAQDCDVTGGAEVTCNGVFANDVSTYLPENPDDLTLIVGTDGETTVDPGMGIAGISNTWGGDVTITTYAEINTYNAHGIDVYTDGVVTVSNFGSIATYTTGAGEAGIQVGSNGYDITVVNGGDVEIDTNSSYGVDGIYANSNGGFVSIDNQAGANVYSSSNSGDAVGISVGLADQGANVVNDGSVFVDSFSGEATGIFINAFDGDADVTNGGYISSLSLTDQATGIEVSSFFYDASVTNTGTIHVASYGYAEGIYAESSLAIGDVYVNNSGTLEVTSYDSGAVGIKAYGKYADVVNSGAITVTTEDNATGIDVYGLYGATITNSGPITVTAYNYGADAAGIAVEGSGSININNSGDITVTSNGNGDGPVTNTILPFEYGANAVGIHAVSYYYGEGGQPENINSLVYGYGPNDVNEVNSADILINAAGNGVGMYAAAFGAGNVYMSNTGTVSVYAGGYGLGMWAEADTGTIEILSSGQITVGTDTDGATGIYAYSTGDGGTVSITNSAGIEVYSNDEYAIGIWAESFGNDGDIAIDNSGTIEADSTESYAIGIFAYTWNDYNDVSITTTGGLIDVYSYDGYATGIEALVYGYDATLYVNNGGDINASSYWDAATGIAGTTRYDAGSLEIQNSGVVTVDAYDQAQGIAAYGNGAYGDTTVGNSGTLDVTSYDGDAIGIYAFSSLGNVYVDNSGAITANGDDDAYGIYVESGAAGGGSIYITSSGTISVTANYGDAYGIYAATEDGGSIDVQNSGTIDVTKLYGDYDAAFGVYTWLTGDYESSSVDNSGSISVDTAAHWGVGIYSQSGGDYSSLSVTNSGTVEASSDLGWGIGLYEWSNGYGVSHYIGNSGSVSATGYETAHGIHAFSAVHGDIEVNNSGSIDVYSEGYDGGSAVGIYTVADDDFDGSTILVDNSGTIDATGYSDAYGVYVLNAYSGKYGTGNYTTTDVYNSGSISATSYYTQAYGIAVFAGGDESYVMVDNSGTVTATGYSAATGILAENNGKYLGGVDVYNTGNVSAYAVGDISTNATGIEVFGDFAYAYNGGSSYAYSAAASAYATGIQVVGKYSSLVLGADSYTGAVAVGEDYALAEGAFVAAQGAPYSTADVFADGAIYASATADGETGSANAAGINIYGYYGAYVEIGENAVIEAYAGAYDANAFGVRQITPGTASFSNSGAIYATVDGVYGYAMGALISSDSPVYAYNHGYLNAYAHGDSTQSVGITIESDDAGVFNDGTIYAYAENIATGVWLSGDGYGYVNNYGTIEAYGGVHSLAIYADGLSADYIHNQGTIIGEIWTNAGNDVLYNGTDGVWYTSSYSYFGDGDDGIWNYGVIAMYDANIDLGYHDVSGNYFYNYGVIAVEGYDNVIHMGHGPVGPVVPSLNPLAFYNGIGGTIDFQDGYADDMLTIVGDFAGDGDINVDVSGLTGYSDILYIDGSVVEGTAGVLNIELLDLPNVIESLIPIVYVSGDSVDGNFVLGDINWDADNAFVTLDFGIVSVIDASNADPDVFALGIEVTGLSDPGTLAASIAPSALSLINTQVGTWRQRMGVIDSFNKQAIALWARVFSNEGSFQPDHSAVNFGPGGNFDWEQKNSGVEAGADFAVTDEFSLGFLLAQSQADTDLEAGNGSADMDADTWGVYGTWISPNGWYLDASYRWTDFEVDMSSSAGGIETEGDAETFNIEVGYAWTLSGGLKIEPQLQYTKTRVDNISVLETTTGMSFEYDSLDSSRGRLGVAIRKGFGEADTGWLWTPYAALSVIREFDGEANYSINESFFGQSTVDGTSVLVELGFTARHQNWAVYGGLNFEDGGAVEGFFGGQLGVRYTFAQPAPAPAPVVVPAKTCAELDDDGDGVNNCDDKCLGSPAGEAVGPDGCPVPPPVMEPKPFRG